MQWDREGRMVKITIEQKLKQLKEHVIRNVWKRSIQRRFQQCQDPEVGMSLEGSTHSKASVPEAQQTQQKPGLDYMEPCRTRLEFKF